MNHLHRGNQLNVLYVVHGIPRVPAPGGPTRAYHLVRAVASIARVTLLCVVERGASRDPSEIAQCCSSVQLVPAPKPAPRLRARRLEEALGPRTSVLWRFDPAPMLEAARRILISRPIDVVIVEHTEMAHCLLNLLVDWRGPAIVDLHNVLSVYQGQVAASALWGRLRRRLAIRSVRAEERAILRGYSAATCTSPLDARRLAAIERSARPQVVPNGVDMSYFQTVRPDRASKQVVFTGALWYRPNVDGMLYFAARIWPQIRSSCPDARLAIVGARPCSEVAALDRVPGIDVHASVPDVRPFLAASAAAIVPLRLGSGTRLKILEALAAGLPVVSTSLGAEGLALRPGVDFLRADEPGQIARHTIRLLRNPVEAGRLAVVGGQTVRRLYSWDAITPRFQNVVRAMAGETVEGPVESRSA